MSGLTLSVIREALATQINNNTAEDISVHARPVGSYTTPAISIVAAPDYVEYWQTFGPQGLSLVRFNVQLELGGLDADSAAIAVDDFLSAGTGNGSSVIDAINVDRYLGFGVDGGVSVHCPSATYDPDTLTAFFTVEVHIAKQGAAV